MTNEQWLVYLWSIYPDGGFIAFYMVAFSFVMAFLVFSYLNYTDALKRNYDNENRKITPETREHYLKTTTWYKLGKLKIVIPSILLCLIFISKLIPNRDGFMYIVATPYVVESGKSLVESLNDETSKLYKLNKIMDKGLGKMVEVLDDKGVKREEK